jgi:hypothetical protein
LWPTPNAFDAENWNAPEKFFARQQRHGWERSRPCDLSVAAQMFPTPSAISYGSNQGGAMGRVGPVRHSLESMARHGLWPTPTSLSPAKNGNNEAGNSCGLVAIKKRILAEDPKATGSLNPTWVEWLMGFPLGWTDCGASETRSSRRSRK